ncbi:hypothetical protein QM646_07900 [Rhodococcus erythropolis]|nr:hypothetical protein [Rhodococcus erythropolis]
MIDFQLNTDEYTLYRVLPEETGLHSAEGAHLESASYQNDAIRGPAREDLRRVQ